MADRYTRRVLALALSCLLLGAAVGPAVGPAVATTATNGTAAERPAGPALNATGAWEQGYTGDNVTVAVVDGSFNASNPAIADQVVGTHAVPGPSGDFQHDDAHGTAVAEVVAQGAPDADLLLYDASDTNEDMATAIRDASERADVIVTARGDEFGVPLDGSMEMAQAIDDARDDGTTVVVSAGNEGRFPYYHGTWTDEDGDGWHEFATGDETMTTTVTTTVRLQWNDWGGVDSDYDVVVFDQDGNKVAEDSVDQRETGTPYERKDPPHERKLTVKIRGTNPDSDDRLSLRLFPDFGETEHAAKTSTLVPYAAAEGAIAVGAYDTYTEAYAPYSSRGPTVDGRMKPDVTGPTNVTTRAKGEFTGTSAAAPAVASTAALMEEANGSITPERTRAILAETARPVTGDEPNNRTGYGLVDATAAVDVAEPATVEPIDGTTPTDPDGDGRFEDLDGDGTVTTLDAERLFQHLHDPSVTDHAEAYDFTGDGTVSHSDVVELHEAAVVEPIDGTLPTDPDGDGLFEDVDGDGTVTTDDANVLFDHMRENVVTDHVAAYDFSGNGEIGHADVVSLYEAAG